MDFCTRMRVAGGQYKRPSGSKHRCSLLLLKARAVAILSGYLPDFGLCWTDAKSDCGFENENLQWGAPFASLGAVAAGNTRTHRNKYHRSATRIPPLLRIYGSNAL